MPATFRWDPDAAPKPLADALRALAEEYPVVESGRAGTRLDFAPSGAARGFAIRRSPDVVRIEYARTCDALRALGIALSGLVKPGAEYREQNDFATLGIMLDCSRNAVMKVEHFKGWLRRLSLMGYNMAMLYTEDTYELPGEDYFGFLRGRYTAAELREIDRYAGRLGIEMIGCIQTLGHLAQILKWGVYGPVRDTGEVLFVGEPKTYELVDKMIRFYSQVFRSRRIHVGMDETHDLGRGRYMDIKGYRRGYDLFNEHLGRVTRICRRRGMKPMIWSDMFFRMGSQTMGYYDKACRIPPDVKANIPSGAQLVYWDYYHDNEEFYLDWIGRHRELGFEPIMGSGVWTWRIPWYGRAMTEKTVGPCVRACRKAGLKEIFFTLWGDDGAYCDFDSALAGLLYAADLSCAGKAKPAVLEKRFRTVCSASYKANALAGDLNKPHGWPAHMWDDPMLGVRWHLAKAADARQWDAAAAHYARLAKKLAPYRKDHGAGGIAHAVLLARTLSAKMALCSAVRKAYAVRDITRLKALGRKIPEVQILLNDLDASFRRQWLRRNKPFGLEVLQIRLASQVRRFGELAQRLGEFTSGRVQAIPEFDEPTPLKPCYGSEGFRFQATSSHIL